MQKTSQAFTLIELLVVVAIIGILAALLLASISAAKERAIRAKCLSNVHQITLATLNYALDNRDRIPTVTGTTQLPIMVSGPASTEFIPRYCPTRDVFYDPGNPNSNQDYYWKYMVLQGNLVTERMIGYVLTFPVGGWLKPEYVNTFATPQVTQVGAILMPAPISSDRVLMSCVVASEPGQDKTNANIRVTYNYLNIQPAGPNDGDDFPPNLRTAHVKGKLPTGGNLGMLDGSARWRKFAPMVPRTIAGASTFWW